MKTRWCRTLCACLLLAGCSSESDDKPPASQPPVPAEPGVCFGASTRCDPPTFLPVAPSTEVTVTCTVAPDLEPVWIAELGTFECSLPDCPAVNPLVASAGGRIWAVAEVREPSLEGPLGSPEGAVGFVVVTFDEDGKPVHDPSVDLRARLEGLLLPGQYTRFVHAASDGSMVWLTSTADGTGIETRPFGVDGKGREPRPTVTGARWGQAIWDAAGSSTVAYRYTPGSDAEEKYLPGIASFDAGGRLLYNQTLLAETAQADPELLSVRVSAAGFASNGDAIVRGAEIRRTLTPREGPNRFLRLDRDGNVVWAKELPDSNFPLRNDAAMTVRGDGSSLVVHLGATPNEYGFLPMYVEELDANGDSRSRLRIESEGFQARTVAFAGENRVVLAEPGSGQGSSAGIVVVDRAASSCTHHRLRVPACAVDGHNHGCHEISVVAAGEQRVHFGIANWVGAIDLP